MFVCLFLSFHTIREVLRARILEWFAILSSSGHHGFSGREFGQALRDAER